LAAWKAQGMSDADHDFLAAHPHMVEADRLTAIAAHQAATEGHQRDSDDHRKRTRELFDQHLARFQSQAPTPQFFTQPPPPEPPSAAAYVSAPVSREAPSGSGTRRELSPSQVKLSPQQREAAMLAGISEVEYARNLQKLAGYKRERGVEHE